MGGPASERAVLLVVDSDGHERFLAQYVAIPWVMIVALLVWLRRPGKLERGLVLAMLAVLFSMFRFNRVL